MSLTAIPEDAGESGRESASPDRMAPPSTLHIQPVVDSQRGPAGYTAGASACLVYVCVCVWASALVVRFALIHRVVDSVLAVLVMHRGLEQGATIRCALPDCFG
jgi:hypothetical protein